VHSFKIKGTGKGTHS